MVVLSRVAFALSYSSSWFWRQGFLARGGPLHETSGRWRSSSGRVETGVVFLVGGFDVAVGWYMGPVCTSCGSTWADRLPLRALSRRFHRRVSLNGRLLLVFRFLFFFHSSLFPFFSGWSLCGTFQSNSSE